MKLYTIEFYMEPPVAKWAPMSPFTWMRKCEAFGAWGMLKAFYNQKNRHRLVCDGEVVEEIGLQQVGTNTERKETRP
jgi:predicted NUDIX family NTP pyrophosphohydrolase